VRCADLVQRARATASGGGALEQILGRQHLAHQTTAARLVGADPRARVGPLCGARDPNDPGQEPRRACVGDNAALDEREAEEGVIRHDAHVGSQRERRPESHGRAVDRSDDRLEAVVHPQSDPAAPVAVPGSLLLGPIVEGLATGGQVRAGAEPTAGPGDDDCLDIVVPVGLGEGVD
jgi:hypothetical protein